MSRESFGLAESSHINEHCKREVVDLIAVACAVPRSFAALPVRPMHVIHQRDERIAAKALPARDP